MKLFWRYAHWVCIGASWALILLGLRTAHVDDGVVVWAFDPNTAITILVTVLCTGMAIGAEAVVLIARRRPQKRVVFDSNIKVRVVPTDRDDQDAPDLSRPQPSPQ